MKLIETHARILRMGSNVFRTADAAAYLGVSNSTASRLLARLATAGHLLRLRHGVWAVPGRLDPLALASHLTAPFPSYVSLQSALYYHGVISQIPNIIYAVSVGRTRLFRTPLGTVSIHHLQPDFFFGFEVLEAAGVSMASPEKALVDYLYLRPARSNLFRALPEVELPSKFNIKLARRIIERIPSVRRRTLVARAFDKLLAGTGSNSPEKALGSKGPPG
jgi:predicted transcriptional regulator of viral defense system